MFRWLKGPPAGLEEVQRLFTTMLADGRHVFDLAMSARVGGADPAAVAYDLDATEERTDEMERDIRRRLLVHASTHGTEDLATILMFMSVAKDAERIADLSKGIFGIAEIAGAPTDEWLRQELSTLAMSISPMVTETGRALVEDDTDAAEAVIADARHLQASCRQRIEALLREEEAIQQPAATALTYRHCSRITANLLNIASAVTMPLDRLDYPARPHDP